MDISSFRKMVADSIHASLPEVNEAKLKAFLEHVHYVRGQYDRKEGFPETCAGWKATKRAGRTRYVSRTFPFPPTVSTSVLKNMCAGGVHDGKVPFRCIVEKPVGHDLNSFEQIKGLTSCFREEIFCSITISARKRSGISTTSGTPIPSSSASLRTLIHHVEVTASEAAGIERPRRVLNTGHVPRHDPESPPSEMCALLTMRLIEEGESFREQAARAGAILSAAGIRCKQHRPRRAVHGRRGAGKKSAGIPGGEGHRSASRTNIRSVEAPLAPRAGRSSFLSPVRQAARKEGNADFHSVPGAACGRARQRANRLDIILQGGGHAHLSPDEARRHGADVPSADIGRSARLHRRLSPGTRSPAPRSHPWKAAVVPCASTKCNLRGDSSILSRRISTIL